MNPELIHRWLAAEIEGRDVEAEEVLFDLFRALPLAVPSAGFADRVLVGAGLMWSRRARAATATGLLLAGLAAAFLVPPAIALLQLVTPGDVLTVAAQGMAGVANTLDELLALGRFAARVRETLWLVVATPPVALTLLAMTAVAALAGRWLAELLSLPRRPWYVQAQ